MFSYQNGIKLDNNGKKFEKFIHKYEEIKQQIAAPTSPVVPGRNHMEH